MAETNANIGVRVGGDITPLQRSFKKGESIIGDFSSKARSAANDITKLGAAASVAAAGGVAAMYASTAQSAREIKNLSNLANTSVESFQKMAYAAKSVDITMEKLGDILKDTNDKIGDFSATGGGAMADFFENIGPKVGLTADNFKKLSGPEALQAYYNGLERANLGQKDMTFYMEAIASDSTALIPLLKNNGQALKEMGREAEELDIVMSGIDIAQIEAANKQMKRATSTFKSAGQAITVELAPYVEAVLDHFVEMSKEAGGFGNIAKDSFTKAAKVVGFVADAVHGLKVVFKGLHVAAAGVGTGIVVVFNGVIQKVDELLRSMIDGVNAVTDQLSRIPGVDINDIGYPEFGSKVNEITQASVANLKQLSAEFHTLAMQPLPSDGIEEFLDTVKQKSIETAAEVAKITSNNLESGQSSESNAEDPRIKALKEKYLTEEELERQHKENMMLIGEEYDSRQFSSEKQWREVRAQAIKEHVDAVTNIREQEKISAINIASNLATSVMSLAQGQSKKAFEITKKAAIAASIIKGYEAATSAWAAGMATGGPWAPAVAASYTAASLAKTGAQVRALQSQSYGGGASQSNAGGGGFPTPDSVGAGVGGGQSAVGAQGSGGSVAINLPAGALIRGDALLEMIEESVNNGYNVNFLRA